MEFRIQKHEQVESTNLLVKQAIDAGEPEGFTVVARNQTAGYGRQGRAWQSFGGGVYLSVLLRPLEEPRALAPDRVPTLTLVAGLAVIRALRNVVGDISTETHGHDLHLKWPNDIIVDSWQEDGRLKKVAGISAEMRNGAICLGIGVNVHRPEDGGQLDLEGRNIPAFLDDLGLQGEYLCETITRALLDSLNEVYELWCERGFGPFATEYNRANIVRGVDVVLQSADGQVLDAGRAVQVDESGRLVLEDAKGSHTAYAGDVHLAWEKK